MLIKQWEAMEIVCNIEIIKEGIDFVVKVYLPNGSLSEYRQDAFEDVLTEMVINLQEELSEWYTYVALLFFRTMTTGAS